MSPGSKDAAPFPTRQLIILGICRFSEPLAFNSILAYAPKMVGDLGISERNIAFCSGALVSAYAVAEALTALGWGAISDVYGRKPVALIGLGGVALSSLLFGLSKSFWVALLARFVGGALNGNVAVMQTMVAEMVKNPDHEPRAYATQPFVWTLGGIIGSAMGGFLAQPAKYYPHIFPADGLFGRFPYLLPNLVAAIGISLAIIQGIFFLEETNPNGRPQEQPVEESTTNERTSLLHRTQNRGRNSSSRASGFRERSNSVISTIREDLRQLRKKASFMEESLPLPMDQRFDIRRSSFGTMHSIHIPPPSISREEEGPRRRTFNFTVIMLTVALVFIAYHQMAYITAMPVWLLDDPATTKRLDLRGGLGESLHDVGTYLAVNGVIALFIQGLIFPFFVEWAGVWNSFISMIILYPITYIIIPFFSALPRHLITPAVYLSFILQSFFGIIAVPCALILLKNATPSPLKLGRVNGLAMSLCCLARTVSPPLVGVIYALGGSAAAWFSLAVIAIFGAVQLIWVPNEHVDRVHIESGLKAVVEQGHAHVTDEEAVVD